MNDNKRDELRNRLQQRKNKSININEQTIHGNSADIFPNLTTEQLREAVQAEKDFRMLGYYNNALKARGEKVYNVHTKEFVTLKELDNYFKEHPNTTVTTSPTADRVPEPQRTNSGDKPGDTPAMDTKSNVPATAIDVTKGGQPVGEQPAAQTDETKKVDPQDEYKAYKEKYKTTEFTFEDYDKMKKDGKTDNDIWSHDLGNHSSTESQARDREKLAKDASYTRSVKNAELAARKENQARTDQANKMTELEQAQKVRADAKARVKENPTAENQEALDKAIQQEKDLQAEAEALHNATDKWAQNKQEAVDAAVKNGDLSKKTVTDPPGHEAENEMWLKSNKHKYKATQTLKASQDDPADRKYINFKQDYVVLIRKKPFYAATAQQRYATADIYNEYSTKNGTNVPDLRTKVQSQGEKLKDATGREILPEDNYLRVYQINNFFNISINTTVNAPGTCTVTIKGAERVICAENHQQSEMGFYNWSDLMGSWLDISENATVNDGTGTRYVTTSASSLEQIRDQNQRNRLAGHDTYTDSSRRSEAFGGPVRKTGQLWRQATSNWSAIESGLFNEGQIFRNLFKTREAKYGWRFAEKCDWEPMDEILIFGKSHTLRVDDVELDDNERDDKTFILKGYQHNPVQLFKMEPLFFGYIESINKTYDASRGCMISVNAKDHLKLMEICQACTNGGSVTGRMRPAINWSHMPYGLCTFENPIGEMVTLSDGMIRIGASLEKLETARFTTISSKEQNLNLSFIMKNIMCYLYIDEIVQLMASASGIPDKFLLKRVEPMHRVPPFWQDPVNTNLDFFNGQTDSRYTLCQKAAQQIMVEFFADEEGNIVVKIPNWVLGANLLQMNNCNIKYYDDVRYSDLPNFYANDDGSIDVSPPGETTTGGGSGGTGTDGLIGNTGIGFLDSVIGFINKAIGSLLDALGGLFNITPTGRTNPEPSQIPVEVPDPLSEDAARQRAEDGRKRKEEEEEKKRQREQGGDYSLPNVNIVNGSSENIKAKKPVVIAKEETDEADYAYANITNNVAEDVLDELNSNVIQLDDYKIKVKLGDVHDKKYGSLYSLADYYYGNKYKWHLIAEANHIHEPTEVYPGQWLTIYFNEPISNFIINSLDDNNINNQINGLKTLREEKIKQLGINMQDQDNSMTIVQYFPFVKGKFISVPQSMQKQYKQLQEQEKKLNTITSVLAGTPIDIKKVAKEKEMLEEQQQLMSDSDSNSNDKIIHTHLINQNLVMASAEKTQAEIDREKSEERQQRIKDLQKLSQGANATIDRLDARKFEGDDPMGNPRFRSSRTDIDIPAIPNEYVISFTLTDSDQEVYNYIEVAGSQAYGIMQGDRTKLGSIFASIPDYDHIMQFGLREHPSVNTSPLAYSLDSAQILGAMLLYKSQCNRYTGVLTCVEDSAIRVGNPVRIYIYDEHPYAIQRKFGLRQDPKKQDEEPSGVAVFDESIFKEQAVFYVESISRNIDIQSVSTMTLQLKAGRTMGMTNAFDILSLYYDLYYQPWQSRIYYYNQGGNNTALDNAHEIDLTTQMEAHKAAWTNSKWTAEEKVRMIARVKKAQAEIQELNRQEEAYQASLKEKEKEQQQQ